MTVSEMSAVAVQITDAPGLDAIHVFWMDFAPGRGSVTMTCWGSAWTCYFGAMNGMTIREFFARCDTGYLVNKLGISDVLKRGKTGENYLRRVIEAVQHAISEKAEN